ncbi:MAG: D-glycero-beta-D-manno-heptose-7-phosphate kinase [Pyrinomonadaceae bacterium]
MHDTANLEGLLEKMPTAKVLVVGDVMLDRYWWGEASRLSPEAPVPVVALKRVSNRLGGAANVAANIAALGAEAVLVGIVGADEAGGGLRAELGNANIADDSLVGADSRPTTIKTRVMVHNQQIARIDEEANGPLAPAGEDAVIDRIARLLPAAGAVVLSDYAKGCLTERVAAFAIDEARRSGKIIVADPKSRDLTKYSRATFLTPNLSEALSAARIENGGEERADEAAELILAETEVDSLLITLGEHGMKLYEKGRAPVHFPSAARQVFDVTGAGDTVVALLAAAIAAGADIATAISFANIGAGLTVEKVGTSVASSAELLAAIRDQT